MGLVGFTGPRVLPNENLKPQIKVLLKLELICVSSVEKLG